MNTVVVQAWLVYSSDAAAASCTRREKLPLLDFKLSIAAYLHRVNKNGGAEKRGRPSMNMEVQLAAKAKWGPAAPVPQRAIRTDRLDHWPLPGDKKGRCKRPGCKGTPIWKCSKCKVKPVSHPSQQLLPSTHSTMISYYNLFCRYFCVLFCMFDFSFFSKNAVFFAYVYIVCMIQLQLSPRYSKSELTVFYFKFINLLLYFL